VSQTLWRGTRNGITKFRTGRHLYSAGRPSRWASAHILEFVLSFNAKVCHPNVLMNIWLQYRYATIPYDAVYDATRDKVHLTDIDKFYTDICACLSKAIKDVYSMS